MNFLLDTCIVSKLRKLSMHPDKRLETWINKHSQTQYFLSVVTIGEIQSGISKLQTGNKTDLQKKMIFEDWLHGELIPRFSSRILGIDIEVMIKWGQLNGRNKSLGYNLPFADGLIAATALYHNLIVVTENTKDFEQSGVEIINPWFIENKY